MKNTKKSIKKKTNKTKKNSTRPSPSESATLFPEGTIKKGNDKQNWVITVTNKGVHRWIPLLNAEINGVKLLTVDYLAKNIGKTVKYLEGEYQEVVPKSINAVPKLYLRVDTITPNGDISINGKIIKNWLLHRTPELPDNKMIFVLTDNPDELTLQIDSKNKKTCSTNVMNMQTWVKA